MEAFQPCYNTGVQLWEHLKQRVTAAITEGRQRREGIRSPEDLAVHVKRMRDYFLDCIGGLPESSGAVPLVLERGEIYQDQFVIRKILLETRPSVWASVNLYLPRKREKKLPAILFLCGHSVHGKGEPRYQAICQLLVQQGHAVLALDPTGQGERLNYYDPPTRRTHVRPATGDHEYSGFQCLLHGQNLSRYMLHDAIRAIDYLSAHPEIDSARIGITGASGGGAQTALMMLVEPRLAAAAPATFISSRQAIFNSGSAQDAEQIWSGFTAHGYDHADLLAAFAPKPLCILSVTSDFFPIEGTRDTLMDARRFWEMHQANDLSGVEDRSPHLYTQALGGAAAAFFNRCFLARPGVVPAKINALLPSSLWCTRIGQIRDEFANACTIHLENKREFLKGAGNSKAAVDFLRKAVFQHRHPVDGNLRITGSNTEASLRFRTSFWWSQSGLINSGIMIDRADVDDGGPVTLAVWTDGTSAIGDHEEWIRQEVDDGRSVWVLNLTGMGSIEPHPFNINPDLKGEFGTFFRICDDLVSLGDSLAAMRTYDILRAIDVLPEWGRPGVDSPLRIYGHGSAGIYAFLAASLDSRLVFTQWCDPLPPYAALITSEFYEDYDIKSYIVPGLVALADWSDLADYHHQQHQIDEESSCRTAF